MKTTLSDQAKFFDAIADRYAAKDVAPSTRQARRHRLRQTWNVLPLVGPQRVLEIGCGAGYAAKFLAGDYEEYLGVDCAEELIKYAIGSNASDRAAFLALDANDLKPDREFDVVLMIGVIHHFSDPAGTMQRIVSMVRPGGWVVANEPQSGNPIISVARAVRARIDSSYSPDQVTYTPQRLKRIFAGAGLSNIILRPQGLFSTPFAEVVMNPQSIFSLLAKLAIKADAIIEGAASPLLKNLSWNVIAAGRRIP